MQWVAHTLIAEFEEKVAEVANPFLQYAGLGIFSASISELGFTQED